MQEVSNKLQAFAIFSKLTKGTCPHLFLQYHKLWDAITVDYHFEQAGFNVMMK